MCINSRTVSKIRKKYSGTAGAQFFLLHSAPILIIYGQGGGGEAADGPAGDAAPGPVQTSDRQHGHALRAPPHREAPRSQASLHPRGVRR